MTNIDAAYIAGLFDGEGCVLISTKQRFGRAVFWLEISITNTDKPVLDWILATVGGRMQKKPHNKKGNRDLWRWRASSREAAGVLEILLPYLRIKREQARLAIEFQKLLSAKAAFTKSSEAEIASLAEYRERLVASRRRIA
jgi:hypothetical protein